MLFRSLSASRSRRGLLVSVLVAACAPQPTGAPRTTVPAPDRVAATPAGERWTVRPNGATRSHLVHLDAILVSRVDSVERTDSLRATLGTSWTYAAPPSGARDVPARIAGSLTTFGVAFGGASPLETPAALTLPVVYAAEQSSQVLQPVFTFPRAEECGPAAAALATVRELWVSLPETLVVGATWADSAEFTTCRDSIPLAVSSTRSYRVVGVASRDGRVAVRVDRSSLVRMSGAGSQFGEPLQVDAEGSGSAQLEVSLEGGAILSGTGESELRMTMRGRRRTQQLEQRTRLSIAVP